MTIIDQAVLTFPDVLRPTIAEVNLTRIAENYREIERAVSPATVMPVLKANAYGHGMIKVAEHLVGIGVNRLAVALLEEGLLLRESGIDVSILVLGGLIASQIPLYLKNNLTLTASSIEKLTHIDEAAQAMKTTAKVHLEIDTGMERTGVHYYSAAGLLETSLNCRAVEVEGVYSHFANSDAEDLTSTRIQLERFLEALSFYEKRSISPPIRHIANSGGTLQMPESRLDMVRPGIMLYGVYPSRECKRTITVRAALALKSKVAYFKVVEPHTPISYGSTWQTDHRVRVVTVPIGYGDGYPRGLSSKAQVLIRGKRHPVAGRVCMDQFMINIEWDEAFNGDVVTLIGEDGEESITCDELADLLGTIPYEILTGINTRVPRVYVSESQ